jgi:5-methylcytosine-specific restriction endonuclease McrA
MARDYKKEYANYQGKPEQIKNRAERNAARREMAAKGAVRKGDGMDVDHKVPIAKGGGNSSGNLRVVGKSANRSFPRTKSGKMR